MPQACYIVLPLPPSVNGLYSNRPGKGRVCTPEYRQWKHDAGWALQASPRAQFAGPFRVRLLVPEKMRGDVDGRIKAAVDLLVRHKVTPDDRFAKSVSA